MVTRIDAAGIQNVIAALKPPFHLIAVEPLFNTTQWGELLNHPSGDEIKAAFLGNVIAFEEFLSSMYTFHFIKSNLIFFSPDITEDLSGRLEFNVPFDALNQIKSLQYPAKNIMRNDPELFKAVEKIVGTWYKKIEHVLEEADLVRAESDSVGPRAELDYWRSLLTKFNTIMEFLESETVNHFLKAVEASRSPYVLVRFFLVFDLQLLFF